MNFGRTGISRNLLLSGMACAASLILANGALAQGPTLQTLGKSKGSPFGDKFNFSIKNFDLDAFKQAVESCAPDCRLQRQSDRLIMDIVVTPPVIIPPPNPNTLCPLGQVLGPQGFCVPIKKP